ncbi:response regulator [Methylomonas sp. LL1]|uniref:response regulator n=1 Tax=Methylomonas sp. LL1 TaxID=2785785 RepID=UPI0018C377E7|nr:response regulator [Methylomonas sp. LL1]QPK64591.1 response regulator [Methylomonas sp. LL1]CAG1022260.1 Transcriptional regulatory protein WalR [Methylococcales bacterium]
MNDTPKFVLTLYVSSVDDNTEQRIKTLHNLLGECFEDDSWKLSRAKHVLVIDDEASVRDAFELALSSAGYQVECVADGEAGIAAAARFRPDMVFVDLKMPGLDGLETLRRLLARYESPPPACIITTFAHEYAAPLQQARAEKLEFQLASKPLSTDQIRRVTRAALGVHA